MKRGQDIFRILLACFLLALSMACNNSQIHLPEKEEGESHYQCLPCGQNCDTATFSKPGECRHCHMQLVRKSSIVFKSVAASSICDYIKMHPSAILLDVRTKEEFEGKANPDFGILKNAINIPVQELESKLPTLIDLKNKEILVYCSHSHRSPRASYMLTQNGFSNVTNMEGGMSMVTDKSCKK